MKFLTIERNAAILLAISAIAGLVVSNSAFGSSVIAFINAGFSSEYHVTPATIISDFLLVSFFLMVGLELKRELTEGSLNTRRKLAIPAFAAVLGVAFPAATYLLIVGNDAALIAGWAIPTATDVTFALAVFAIFGARLKPDARTFLLSFAVIDDVIAILIIALFFGHGIEPLWLIALLIAGAAFALAVRVKTPVLLQIVLGLGIWFATLQSGIHPTVSGVIIAMLIPTKKAKKLETVIHPWVSIGVLPIFAFVAMSIKLGDFYQIATSIVFLAVFARFVAKAAGISLGAWLASVLLFKKSERSLQFADYFAVSLTGGIGFTVAFLITAIVFEGENASAAIAATIASAIIAIILAAVALSLRGRQVSK